MIAPGRLTVLPALAPWAALRTPAPDLPDPLGEDGCTLFHGPWRALSAGLHAVELTAGDAVLVPALQRGPEVAVMRRAGLELCPYAGTPSLEPDARELEALLAPGVRALYLVHHLGFAQDGARWRAWCSEHGLLLLEDATRAFGASDGRTPAGGAGALAVYSLPDAFGVPDGGAVRADRPPVAAGAAGPSRATLQLLARAGAPGAAARRRAHYSLLLEALGERVPAPFDRLPEHAAPAGFPILDDGDEGLRERLRAHGIEAARPWTAAWEAPRPGTRASHAGTAGVRTPDARAADDRATGAAGAYDAAFAAVEERRRRTLLLPVHQGLRRRDVERIAAAVLGASRPRRARRAGSSELRPELLALPEGPQPEWDALALQARNVFATREWIATWWRHFGGGRTLRLVACRTAGGRLVAILPLCEQRRAGARVVRFLGHGPSDACGPICAPADRPAAARALRGQLDALRADVLLGEQVPAGPGWDALLGARVLRREGSPILALDRASWPELTASWGPNWRKQVPRLSRKLEREHALRYRVTEDPAALHADMTTLLDLHGARWGAEATPHFAGAPEFHREFAAIALHRGWLRLLFLELDGRPAAALYDLRFAGAEHYYQAGRDPVWSKRPLGLLVISEAIRLAHAAGTTEFRFGRGEEPYKYRFATADPGLQTFALARGVPRGAALAAVAAVPDPVVERVRGWARL